MYQESKLILIDVMKVKQLMSFYLSNLKIIKVNTKSFYVAIIHQSNLIKVKKIDIKKDLLKFLKLLI